MYVPRRLRKGPEYGISVTEAEAKGLPKFKANLETACGLAKFEPETGARVEGSALKIAEVVDRPSGYSLALYYIGEVTDDEVWLQYVEVFDLPANYFPAEWVDP